MPTTPPPPKLAELFANVEALLARQPTDAERVRILQVNETTWNRRWAMFDAWARNDGRAKTRPFADLDENDFAVIVTRLASMGAEVKDRIRGAAHERAA